MDESILRASEGAIRHIDIQHMHKRQQSAVHSGPMHLCGFLQVATRLLTVHCGRLLVLGRPRLHLPICPGARLQLRQIKSAAQILCRLSSTPRTVSYFRWVVCLLCTMTGQASSFSSTRTTRLCSPWLPTPTKPMMTVGQSSCTAPDPAAAFMLLRISSRHSSILAATCWGSSRPAS